MRDGLPLEDPRQLEQCRRVGGAAGAVRHGARVPRGHDHDLAPRAAGPAGDHVLEPPARVREALALDLVRLEAPARQLARDQLGRRCVAGPARAPVGLLGRDPLGELRRLVAVEEDVCGQSLWEWRGPRLK